MITGITLLILAVLFFCCSKKTYNQAWELFSFTLVFIFSIWFLAHTILYLSISYNFNKLLIKRQSFVESLEFSRKNGRELESATILRDISYFNQYLASEQYDNKIWFFGQYIDDRIETLEPIK